MIFNLLISHYCSNLLNNIINHLNNLNNLNNIINHLNHHNFVTNHLIDLNHHNLDIIDYFNY